MVAEHTFFKHKIKLNILHIYMHVNVYEKLSESNISYFITLIHDVRGECWMYGSRG
jgi:hypothetical protein